MLTVVVAALSSCLFPAHDSAARFAEFDPFTGNVTSETGSLNARAFTISVSGSQMLGASSIFHNTGTGTGTTFNTSDFSPPTVRVDELAVSGANGATWTISFSAPVFQPVFHFADLDTSAWDFSSTTGFTGMTRLTGNSDFDVTSGVVSDQNSGTGPMAHGSAQLEGAFSTVTVTVTSSAADSPTLQISAIERRISFGFLPGNNSTDAPDRAQNFAVGKQAGMEFFVSPNTWTDLDTSFDPPTLVLFCQAGLKIFLLIETIQIETPKVPDQFVENGVPTFSEEATADAYVDIVEEVVEFYGGEDDIIGLSLGTEVDTYLDQNPSLWDDYATFVENVREEMVSRGLLQNAEFGVSATLAALTGADGKGNTLSLADINDHTTSVFATYFPAPIGPGVETPEAADNAIDDLLGEYTGRTVTFTEIGYPSSDNELVLNPDFLESEACNDEIEGCGARAQERFIEVVFDKWDEYAGRISNAIFAILHDLSAAQVGALQPGFQHESLGSLGLREETPFDRGTDKIAFTKFRSEVAKRGWLSLIQPPSCHHQPGSQVDYSGPSSDNCLLAPNSPGTSPSQACDSDSDGFGNACDCDFDQDLDCDEDDASIGIAAEEAVTDINCDDSYDWPEGEDVDDCFEKLGTGLGDLENCGSDFSQFANQLVLVGRPGPIGFDADLDSTGDTNDNCTGLSNPTQLDVDSDGYGNACDGDLDPDGVVDEDDEFVFSACHLDPDQNCLDAGFDLDADGRVGRVEGTTPIPDPEDVGLMSLQLQLGEPGPSALSCAGSVPCP